MLKLIFTVLLLVVSLSGCGGKTKDELLAEGTKQLEKDNPNCAIVLLKNALEKDQSFLEARYQLARAYAKVGKFEQAEKEFKKVLLQNPTKAELKLDLAKLYNSTQKPELAITEAEGYAAAHPDSAEALEVIGIAHAIKNNLPQAENYLLKALQLDPKRVDTKLELASIYAAQQ